MHHETLHRNEQSRTIELEKKKLQKKKEENLLVEANQNQLLKLFNTKDMPEHSKQPVIQNTDSELDS